MNFETKNYFFNQALYPLINSLALIGLFPGSCIRRIFKHEPSEQPNKRDPSLIKNFPGFVFFSTGIVSSRISLLSL